MGYSSQGHKESDMAEHAPALRIVCKVLCNYPHIPLKWAWGNYSSSYPDPKKASDIDGNSKSIFLHSELFCKGRPRYTLKKT